MIDHVERPSENCPGKPYVTVEGLEIEHFTLPARPSEGLRLESQALLAAALAASVAVTRWPIVPPFLFDYDNVNFALALREFAPLLSQPHRGYPLYVGVSRVIHWFGLSPEHTALAMGLLGSVLALLFLIPLAREMFGPRAAPIAALLLFFYPTFIMAGAVDHVRTFLAAGAIATALYIWLGHFKTAAFVLGVAGGFRTDLTGSLLPLLILGPLLIHRVSWKRLIAPVVVFILTVTPWLMFTMYKSGGFHTALNYNSTMLRANAHSIIYEGFTYRAVVMVLFAAYWNGVGSLSWLWAVPAAIRRGFAVQRSKEFAFLVLWFAPPFFLNALIQVTDPDQTLASGAATCLVGAWALSALRARWTVLACTISAGIFLFPIVPMGREASLPWIRRVTATEARALEGIASTPRPRQIWIKGEYPTWRLVSYYFPEDWIEQGGSTFRGNREQQSSAPPEVHTRIEIDGTGNVSAR